MNKLDRIKGALFGVAVGDALGAPVEFMSAAEIRAKHGKVTEMLSGGWLDVVAGEITDDTQMTLCVADGIISEPNAPIKGIGDEFVKWYNGNPKDIGICCRMVIERAAAVANPDWHKISEEVDEITGGRTAGNGALMRTIFPALYYADLTIACNKADEIGKMTHFHEDSRQAVIAYVSAIHEFLHGESLPQVAKISEFNRSVLQKHLDYVHQKVGKTPQPTGYVVDSLACALTALLETFSFEDALIFAVNLGGDADTIGAITGGLAGVMYGFDDIPTRWINALDREIVERLENLSKFQIGDLTWNT